MWTGEPTDAKYFNGVTTSISHKSTCDDVAGRIKFPEHCQQCLYAAVTERLWLCYVSGGSNHMFNIIRKYRPEFYIRIRKFSRNYAD
jgi:hypothetical protein